MTSHLEIDSLVERNSSAIKLEKESQNEGDKILTIEYNPVFDSCTAGHNDPILGNISKDSSFHNRENREEMHSLISKVQDEYVDDTGGSSRNGKEGNVDISEEVMIKTEENIKMIGHREEENDYYDYTTVKIETELEDTAEHRDIESHSEIHSKIIDHAVQEPAENYYYRLPESYYSFAPLITDQCSVHMEENEAEMQQAEKNLEKKDTSSLLKVKMAQRGTARKSVPKKKALYRCLICFASYRNYSTYMNHKNLHFKKGVHQMLRKRRDGKHLKMIRGIAHFQCDKCNKSYTCEASLKMHIKMSHGHVPIKIIKTEPQDESESSKLSFIRNQINKETNEGIFLTSQSCNTQCDNSSSLLKMGAELETMKYSILMLQQDSINAAEDILNEVKMTYNCPECLKFFEKSSSYRHHLNTHLKKKFMLLRSQKVELLKTLKDTSKFPYFSYGGGYITNTNANKHIEAITNKINGDQRVNEKLSNVSQCFKTMTTEEEASNFTLGDQSLHNSKSVKETFSKDNFQAESFGENSSHSIGENGISTDSVSNLASEFDSSKAIESVEMKMYTCSKCAEHYRDPVAFREHLKRHLKEEMNLLHKKKREMYAKHMARAKTFKCEKCDKEYLYDGFLKKHRKFCQGPPRNELRDMFCGFNSTVLNNVNRRDVEIYSQESTSESNIKNGCDQSQNLKPTTIADAEPEVTVAKNVVRGVTSRSDATSAKDGFGVNTSNVEQEMSLQSIMALLNETQHVCPKCPRTFETLSLYWQHLNKHYDRERHSLLYRKVYNARNSHIDKLYKCDQCDKSYVHKNSLDVHVNSQHNIQVLQKDRMDISEEYKCTCGRVYTRKSRMATCFKSHTEAKELPRCSNCKYHFKNIEELNVHRSLVHTEHRYLCKFCPVEYYSVEDLFSHLDIHKKIQLMECKVIAENIEEKQYLKCFICKEISNDLNEFKLHFLNDHRKPYLCTICVKNFNDLDQFMSHTNTYHLSSRERWLLELLQAFFALMRSWECKPCNFRSENPDSLAEHLYDHKTLNVVGLDLLPKSENITPKRKCVDCRRLYNSPKQLEDHRGLYHNPNQDSRKRILPTATVDSDDSMTKCLKCNLQFASEGYLKAHISTMRHVEVQSLLLNEQFESANMVEMESKANVVVTID